MLVEVICAYRNLPYPRTALSPVRERIPPGPHGKVRLPVRIIITRVAVPVLGVTKLAKLVQVWPSLPVSG